MASPPTWWRRAQKLSTLSPYKIGPGIHWFHPHPHERTAEQAYAGLAGLFIVTDAEETGSLGLPAGAEDIPLVIQDRRFDADNQFAYIAPGMAGMMDQMMGILGDRILVNGRVAATLPVATQPYRLRVLNGANARIYKLGWSNGVRYSDRHRWWSVGKPGDGALRHALARRAC